MNVTLVVHSPFEGLDTKLPPGEGVSRNKANFNYVDHNGFFFCFLYMHDFLIKKTVFCWVCHINHHICIAYKHGNIVSNIHFLVQD